MVLFVILIAIDGLAALALLYFFALGLADGSVSAANMGLWLGMLAVVGAILLGGALLRQAGRPVLGNLVLLLLACPAALYGLFIAMLISGGGRWN